MNTNQPVNEPNSGDASRKSSDQLPPRIEPWKITAYALNELEPDARAEVEGWISENPSAMAEVQSIRDTATHIQKELAASTSGGGLDSRRASHVLREISEMKTTNATVQLQTRYNEERRMRRFRRFRTMGLIASGIAASLVAFRLSPWYSDRIEIVSGTKMTFNIPSKIENDDWSIQAETAAGEANGVGSGTRNSGIVSGPTGPGSEVPAEGYVSNYNPELNLPSPQDSSEVPTDGVPMFGVTIGGASPEKRERSSVVGSVANGTDASKSLGDFMVSDGEQSGPEKSVLSGSRGLTSESKRKSDTQFRRDRRAEPLARNEERFSKELAKGNRESVELLPQATSSVPSPKMGLGMGLGGKSSGVAGGLGGGGIIGGGGRGGDRPLGEHDDVRVLHQDSGRHYQLPDELKANVPSLRHAAENAGGDRFDSAVETPFAEVTQSPQSTFSIDVDTASYSKIRQYVTKNVVPNPSAVRIEEMLNYFDYNYPGPSDGSPFAAHMKMSVCPWNTEHRLVRVAIQAKKVDAEQRPASNLVFLVDVSGSMSDANKLPLVKRTLTLLASQLREQDRVAIVVYAGAAGCVLPSTSGASKDRILASIDELQSGGSTNGGQGIELAYRIAKENYVDGGVNRVILCTDGDFNVGVTGTDQLVAMMQENAKSNVFLTCLGYGIGNYNDSMMEQISNKGNGNYGMVDSEMEARKIMIEQLSGTLTTVAKDVKIQIEFNPHKVASYRLIGYENRRLATQDFDNDKKDAGEIGAGHRVTALYEIVPVGKEGSGGQGGELRYGKKQPEAPPKPVTETELAGELANEWMLLKIRSKQPEATESTKQEFVLKDGDLAEETYAGERADMDWAVSVAEFGLLLRHSQLAPGIDWDTMISRAQESVGDDSYRRECLAIMQQAKRLIGK
ncbi:MAG: DUF3520 domain-containing protein [Planctomycetes bacterium]|nr:DUF3520 domain-containing protein [Planctomycetota bacterium]